VDILKLLNVRNPKWFSTSFNRPNLRYEIRPKTNNASTLNELVGILETSDYRNESGIIYSFSRKSCESISGNLNFHGITVRELRRFLYSFTHCSLYIYLYM
jgi:bloom syndrome protein